MLKSFIIKLRHKPKAVRNQVALTVAITFTVVVMGIWLFSVPERFSPDSTNPSPGILSGLRENLAENASELKDLTADLPELTATSSDSAVKNAEAEVVIPNEFPTSTVTHSTNTRAIRLATTSQDTASTSENSQENNQ